MLPYKLITLTNADGSCKPNSASGSGSQFLWVNKVLQREMAKRQVNISREGFPRHLSKPWHKEL